MSGIIRIEKNKNYFVAANEPFEDQRLSWEARGVMAYLLSRPDGWQVRPQHLINIGDAGRDKVRRILKELVTCGYLVRRRERKADGTYEWVSILYESPSIAWKSGDGSTGDGSTGDGFSGDISKTKRAKTKRGNTERGTPLTDTKNRWFTDEEYEELLKH